MKKIAIIGGGITGLAAAWELSRDFKVTVFEKEQQIGGLLGQVEIDGKKVEAFYHHFFKGDSELINLYKKLGLKDELIFYPSLVAILKDGKLLPINKPTHYLLLPFISFWGRLRLGFGTFIFSRLSWSRVKDKTAQQVAIKWMGRESWDMFWSPLFKSKFNGFSDKISAAWFWARIASRLSSREGGREVLGYPKSGFGCLLKRLEEEIIKNGGRVVTGKEVGEDINGFDVILDTAMQKEECLGVVCVILKTDKQMPFYWINVFNEAPFMAAISQNTLVPDSGGLIYLPKYVSADSKIYNASNAEIEHIFVTEFCRLFSYPESKIKEVRVVRAPKAQPVILPGYQAPSRHPSKKLYRSSMAHIFPYDRGLNYAVKEAIEIATLIQKDLGIE